MVTRNNKIPTPKLIAALYSHIPFPQLVFGLCHGQCAYPVAIDVNGSIAINHHFGHILVRERFKKVGSGCLSRSMAGRPFRKFSIWSPKAMMGAKRPFGS